MERVEAMKKSTNTRGKERIGGEDGKTLVRNARGRARDVNVLAFA